MWFTCCWLSAPFLSGLLCNRFAYQTCVVFCYNTSPILLCSGTVIYRLTLWPPGVYTHVWVLFDRHIEFLLELCDGPHSVREFRRPFVCAAVQRVIVHVLPYPTDLCQTHTIKTQLYKETPGIKFWRAWERKVDKKFKGWRKNKFTQIVNSDYSASLFYVLRNTKG